MADQSIKKNKDKTEGGAKYPQCSYLHDLALLGRLDHKSNCIRSSSQPTVH